MHDDGNGTEMVVMSTDRMREALDEIGWSQRELARRLNAHESTVRQMARGYREIPDVLAVWLEKLARFHASLGQPEGWRNHPQDRDCWPGALRMSKPLGDQRP